MPAWITSLLRELVWLPIRRSASSTITSRPACASVRATASPTTPAPTTTHSVRSIAAPCPFLACLPRFRGRVKPAMRAGQQPPAMLRSSRSGRAERLPPAASPV